MIFIENCLDFMAKQQSRAFGAVVTSPPYNIGVDYGCYTDKLPLEQYRHFTKSWLREALRVAPIAVINFGAKTSDPVMLCYFGVWCQQVAHLQQMICWTKSVHVNDKTYGHFKPVNSAKYLTNTYEMIYVVTADGNYKLDKLSIGVPYTDKSNIVRRGHIQDKRDRGNTWFLPYKTRNSKLAHPATYPQDLAEMMIKLTGTRGTIYDPFAGTGTTLNAAKKLGLDAVGTDLRTWADKP